MRFEYRCNNSGGYWWLKDEDWKALEKAGWTVIWGGLWFCNDHFEREPKPKTAPTQPCPMEERNGREWNTCRGHRKFESAAEMSKKDRWLGALAQEAWKEFASIEDAVREFEKITGQNIEDEGCRCCGEPHCLSEAR